MPEKESITDFQIKNLELSFESLKVSMEKNINELKDCIKILTDKEENRRALHDELETKLLLHCKDCEHNREGYLMDLNNLAEKVRNLESKPGKMFQSAKSFMEMLYYLLPWLTFGILAVGYFLLKSWKVIP